LKDKQKSLPELKRIVSRLKESHHKIVFTNGCFDLLHRGHIHLLDEAKQQGDILIVAINSDASIRSIKGDQRPILPQDERAEIIAALEMVDYVVIFDEHTPDRIIRELVPDVLVKGGDWDHNEIVGRNTVEDQGGRVVRIPTLPGASTSNIIDNICRRFGRN
jgi:D-beta-D-heptose 7-phosphate kinase/D-beta-D-heptose 1-phosphate adenosyltransferase